MVDPANPTRRTTGHRKRSLQVFYDSDGKIAPCGESLAHLTTACPSACAALTQSPSLCLRMADYVYGVEHDPLYLKEADGCLSWCQSSTVTEALDGLGANAWRIEVERLESFEALPLPPNVTALEVVFTGKTLATVNYTDDALVVNDSGITSLSVAHTSRSNRVRRLTSNVVCSGHCASST
jgi:hypothetical protein